MKDTEVMVVNNGSYTLCYVAVYLFITFTFVVILYSVVLYIYLTCTDM